MALWGDRDNFQSVAVGVATVGLTTNNIEIQPGPFASGVGTEGNFITLGLGGTCGFAQIVSVASTTNVGIATTSALIFDATGAISGVAYSISEAPLYLDEDPLAVVGLGTEGTISTSRYVAAGSTAMVIGYQGLATGAYRPAHAGWVGIQTYTDNHGNQRVKTEVFVAMSGIQTGNNPYPNYKQ